MRLSPLFPLLLLSACASLPPTVSLPAALNGSWEYLGGKPLDDPLLSWKDWPDQRLEIDAARGLWKTFPRDGAASVLPPVSLVIAVDDSVVTMKPEGRGREFQIYYRIVEQRLEFWWGSHPDWLKPYVIYVRH